MAGGFFAFFDFFQVFQKEFPLIHHFNSKFIPNPLKFLDPPQNSSRSYDSNPTNPKPHKLNSNTKIQCSNKIQLRGSLKISGRLQKLKLWDPINWKPIKTKSNSYKFQDSKELDPQNPRKPKNEPKIRWKALDSVFSPSLSSSHFFIPKFLLKYSWIGLLKSYFVGPIRFSNEPR